MARRKKRSESEFDAVPKTPIKHQVLVVACGIAGIALALLIRQYTGTSVAEAQVAASRGEAAPESRNGATTKLSEEALPRVERPQHDVMAVVNGEDIRRDALALACVDRRCRSPQLFCAPGNNSHHSQDIQNVRSNHGENPSLHAGAASSEIAGHPPY